MQPYLRLYLESLPSSHSRTSVTKNLRALCRRLSPGETITTSYAHQFPWHEQPIDTYSALRHTLIEEGRAAAYINTLLTTLRQVLNWAMVDDQLSEVTFEKIKRVIPSLSSNQKRQAENTEDDDDVDWDWLRGMAEEGESPQKGDPGITTREAEILLTAPSKLTPKGKRDRAVLMCMTHAGLRREEVAHLRLQDLHFARAPQMGHIDVIGKGAKRRKVPLHPRLQQALVAWITLVMSSANRKKSSTVFRKVNNVGAVLSTGLSNDSVYRLVRQTAKEGGVARVHPHKLRHYFATQLLQGGRDVFEVARLLGHSNVETTRRYDDRGFDSLKVAVNAL